MELVFIYANEWDLERCSFDLCNFPTFFICGYLLNPWSNFRYFTVHKLTESKQSHGMLIMCIQQIYIIRLIQITGNLINSSNNVVLNFFSHSNFGKKMRIFIRYFLQNKRTSLRIKRNYLGVIFLTVSLHIILTNHDIWDMGNLGPVLPCPSFTTFFENSIASDSQFL